MHNSLNPRNQPGPKPKANNGKPKRIRAIMFLSFVLMTWIFSALFAQINELSSKQKQYEDAVQLLAKSKQQTIDYNKAIEHLKQPEYIEERARADLGMLRQGEILFTKK